MKRLRPTSPLLLALVCLMAAPSAVAEADPDHPDPQEIAQRCIHRVHELAAERVQRNHALAVHCVMKIEELLEEGDVEEALRVAKSCVHRINVRSHHTVVRIKDICHECIHILIHLEEPELAEAVGEACQQAVGVVRVSREHAVMAIRDALPGGGDADLISCPADVDGNGSVGAGDLAALVAAWGTDPGGPPDLDEDGVAGFADLLELLAVWGPCS